MTTEELDAEMKRQQDKGPYMAPPEDVAYHKSYMRQALDMGERALTQFNEVPVGCVFVHNNEVIGRGMNDTNRSLCGTRHAEFIAIESILLKHPPSIFRETDLYVTVEPCIMCASALRQLQIRRVFFGCMNERFGGTGGVLKVHEDMSLEPPYKVYGGINHDEAIMLLRRFYIQENGKAPQPITKKQRKLKLEIAPFAGENKLDGVGEGRVMEFVGVDGAGSSSGDTGAEGSGGESGVEDAGEDALKEVRQEIADMGMTSGSDRESSPEAEDPKVEATTA